jgi:ribosomal protein S18 acetylase RimI-like enzyme
VDVRLDPRDVAALFAAASWDDEARIPVDRLDQAFNQGFLCVSAWSVEELIGVVRVTYDGMYASVWNLVTHPEFRGRGVGRSLVTTVLDNLHAREIQWIVGLVAPSHVGRYAQFGIQAVPELTVVSNYPNL